MSRPGYGAGGAVGGWLRRGDGRWWLGDSVTSVGSVSGVVELGDCGDVVVVDDGLGVVVVGEPASGAGAGLSGAASWTLKGFGGFPGLEPPSPMMNATTPATAAPPSAPTEAVVMIVERSRSHSVRRRRSSCADSTVCWLSHDMKSALA